MTIGLTEILSFAALVVSALSLLYAKKQSELAKNDHLNAYRYHLSQSHSAYRKALIEIQKKHENDLNELSILAGKMLTNIVHHFDTYDINRPDNRYLRHLLHESSDIVFCTFKGQLAWQTAENISHRLSQISFIEDNLNPIKNIFEGGSFREVINSKYNSNPNTYLESYLINDIYFCDLVSEIKSRVDQSKTQELMTCLQKEIVVFNQLHSKLKPELSKSADYLKELIYQGGKEHFQLRESYQLFKEIKKTQTTLNTLSYINTPEMIDRPLYGKYHYSVSKSIHICTLLHAIQCFNSWGWDYE